MTEEAIHQAPQTIDSRQILFGIKILEEINYFQVKSLNSKFYTRWRMIISTRLRPTRDYKMRMKLKR